MSMPVSAVGFNPWLYQEYSRDFGLGSTPGTYDASVGGNMSYMMPGMGMPSMGMGMPGMGYGMYGMGMYPPYTKSYLDYMNMDYKERLAYDHDYKQTSREYTVLDAKNAKQYAIFGDNATGNISEACQALEYVVIHGQTDQIPHQFSRIVLALKASPLYDKLQESGAYTKEQIDLQLVNAAKNHFKTATGQDLDHLMYENCKGNFGNGLVNVLTFGGGQNNSREEIEAKMKGTLPDKNTDRIKTWGKVAGTATYTAAGAGIAYGIGCAIASGAAAGSFVPGIGTAIGAVVGLGIGIVGWLASK